MNKIKQKSQARRKKNRLRRHKASVLAVSGVLLLLVAVVTDEYIEQTAKDKLNLVHENEIIFKKK